MATLDIVRYILPLTWNTDASYSVQLFIYNKHTTYHYNTEMHAAKDVIVTVNTNVSMQLFCQVHCAIYITV